MNILMENSFLTIELKYLMIHAKYALVKDKKNLLYLFAVIKYVQIALKNLKNKNNINYVQFVDRKIGMKK